MPTPTTPVRLLLCAAVCLLISTACSAVDLRPGRPVDQHAVSGVTLRIYRVEVPPVRVPQLVVDQTPNLDERRPTVELRDAAAFGPFEPPIVTTVTGGLRIDRPGSYRFRLTSDDGSLMLLGDETVIDNDGRHGMVAAESGPVELAPGDHPFAIRHFDSGGGRRLVLEWNPPGESGFVVVPESALVTENDPTRVTSPGIKRINDGGRPGDGLPLDDVHPAWRVDDIRPEGFEPMVGAMCFDHRDRLIVGTFFPLQRDEVALPDIESKEPDTLVALSGVTLAENPAGDPVLVTIETVAEGLYEPAGLCAVGDALYVSHRREITRLRDLDGDGFYETHERAGSGWEGWNYHQFTFGLEHVDRDGDGPHPGYLYAALSTAMAPPAWEGMGTNAAVNGPMRGGILEVDLSTDDARVIAGGTRTPNGIGRGPDIDGEPTLFYADNQGTWMPTSQFSPIIPGRFYGHFNRTNVVPNLADRFPEGGHPSVYADRTRTPPALFLEQNAVSNSPTESVLITEGPYAGQMLIGELTAGGLRRAFLERVNGVWQGALFRHSQGLEVGVNRIAVGPGGALFIGGIGGNGNWNWRDTRFGLQRLAPTGEDALEFHSVRATPDGFEIRFTHLVEAGWLADASNYRVTQWAYEPTAEYGGPKVDQGRLTVSRAIPIRPPEGMAANTTTAVRIFVPGLKAGRCVHIRCDAESGGTRIRSPEAWYTLNQIPRARITSPSDPAISDDIAATGVGVGVLPPADAAPLITLSSSPAWGGPDGVQKRGRTGRSQDDLIDAEPFVGVGDGDIQTTAVFGDFRLHVEWFSPPGGLGQLAGNSGVYLQDLYEIQVLGTKASDRALKKNEAGAIYNIKPADVNASTGPGTWQAYDIWFEAARYRDGAKIRDARVTVLWNGRLVHDGIPIPHGTGSRKDSGLEGTRLVDAPEPGLQLHTGPIRLQDHASLAEGPVRYRNVWIRAQQPARYHPGPWLDAFDGESLDGWTVVGGNATYHVEQTPDGPTIVGTTTPDTPNTFLVFDRPLDDFELLCDVRQHPELNSGIQIRSGVEGGLSNRTGRLRGLQVELDPSDRAWTGGLYDEGRRGWLYPLTDAPYARRTYRAGEWNRIRILTEGGRVRTWVNGIPAADAYDDLARSGHVALQVHGVGGRQDPLEVRFRNIRIRPLIPADD